MWTQRPVIGPHCEEKAGLQPESCRTSGRSCSNCTEAELIFCCTLEEAGSLLWHSELQSPSAHGGKSDMEFPEALFFVLRGGPAIFSFVWLHNFSHFSDSDGKMVDPSEQMSKP